MNNDFPRLLALLRKEKHLSQKQAAMDLGIAQALLSHYEKGKRECGLEFLVRAADYYDVSTDYLLGRCASRSGTFISENELSAKIDDKADRQLGSLSAALSKKLIMSSIDVIFSLLSRIKNPKLSMNVSNMLYFSIYRIFRLVHKTNPQNPKNMFGIDEHMSYRAACAFGEIAEGNALNAIDAKNNELIEITTASLEEEYQKQAAALLSLVKNCESIITNSNTIT